jgi:serine/threonine-protein kinase
MDRAMAKDRENDAQLARDAATDPLARHALACRLTPRVRRLSASLLRVGSDAEDASQLALLEIMRSVSGFRGESSLETWADRIAVHTALRLAGQRRLGVIAGRYRVERWLGAGGMGIVVAARHIELGSLVAIKLLHADRSDVARNVARFRREARAASSIKSEHTVRVFDVGLLDTGAPYIVMEHLEGEDLAEVLRQRRQLTVAESVDLVLQACEGIAEAHAQGIVHRDLKPANLFIVKRPDGSRCLKVLDFGISKVPVPSSGAGANHVETVTDTFGPLAADDAAPRAMTPRAPPRDAESITATAPTLGSPRYMAPEQIVDPSDVDARADVWALGIVLFELLGGRPPFRLATLATAHHELMQADPPRLRNLRRDVPAGLERATHRCLAKSRDDRWPDVAAFAEAIAPFGDKDGGARARRIASVLHRTILVPPARPRLDRVAWTAGVVVVVAATATFLGASAWPADRPSVGSPRVLDDVTPPSSEIRGIRAAVGEPRESFPRPPPSTKAPVAKSPPVAPPSSPVGARDAAPSQPPPVVPSVPPTDPFMPVDRK